jgi:gliding motility-associated-like protein
LHSNRKDIWIITHNADGNAYNAYLLSSSGLNTTPVQSYTGTWYSSKFNTIDNLGCMSVSPDGSTLANAVYGANKIELLHFNAANGQFKYWFSINNIFGPYGVGFSPASSALYVAHSLSNGEILQYNLISHDTNTIINTVYKLNTKGACGDILLGSDKKMYCPYPGTDSVLMINDPNQTGSACNPVGLKIKGKVQYGLPNIPQSYFSSKDIGYTGTCYTDSLYFYLLGKTQIDSIIWDFGDPGSSNNASHRGNPAHLYKNLSSYSIRCISYKNGKPDTLSKTIQLFGKPHTIDTAMYICPNKSLIINIQNPNYTYQWNDYSTTGLYNVSKAGKYWVEVNNSTCYTIDTFRVLNLGRPGASHIVDTTVCNANNFTLKPNNMPTASYTWQDGSTQPIYTVKKDGIYKVIIAYQCGTDTSIFKVNLNPKLRTIIWKDTTICDGDSIILDAGQVKASYLWQDGSTRSYYITKKEGIYKVGMSNNCDSGSATVHISVIKPPKSTGWGDTTVCNNDNLILSPRQQGFSYLWQDGSKDSFYTVIKPGIYWLKMNNKCGMHSDTMHVNYEDCTLYLQIPNAFSPDGNGVNDIFKAQLSHAPKSYNLSVYNRWGELVFHTDDYTQGWDGNYHSTPALEGVYKYILNADGYRHEDIHKSGTVQLFRN